MKGEKKMTRTTYSISEDLLVRVRLQTVREKRSMSELIRVLLEDYLKKVEGKKNV
jgi:metal-responsive CopG/Arc/MetJ family transcriptional regulator